MIYRLAANEDLDQMMAMVDQAKASFKARGIDQWQKGEPDREGLAAGAAKGQIRVLEEDGRVIGMITLLEGRDPSYAKIDGAWLNDRPYVGFHRVCVAEDLKGRGIAARLFSESEAYSRSLGYDDIRIDTHRNNIPMQKMLEKNGFSRCGIIFVEDGTERIAFQKCRE